MVLEELHILAVVGSAMATRAKAFLGPFGKVAQMQEGTLVIACCIFAPAGQGNIAPAAIATTGRCEHHGITPVRHQMANRRPVGTTRNPAAALGV